MEKEKVVLTENQKYFEEALKAVGENYQIFLTYQARTTINNRLIPYYEYLKGKNLLNNLTIVRTAFPNFEEEEEEEALKNETEKLKEIFSSAATIYLDTPSPAGRLAEENKEIRAVSQKKLRDYLSSKITATSDSKLPPVLPAKDTPVSEEPLSKDLILKKYQSVKTKDDLNAIDNLIDQLRNKLLADKLSIKDWEKDYQKEFENAYKIAADKLE